MAKATAPGSITTASGENFTANALPDPFDARDLEYRPRLEPLPAILDQRAAHHVVLKQDGESCTGHAVAALVNTVLSRGLSAKAQGPLVSPYMLYRLGRRYDEFPGEADAGSSLRGVFKGWFHHGVALADRWPSLRMNPEPNLDDPEFARGCRDRPLGAFYRVSAFRLDDVQSAINELYAVAVSATIHEGWRDPVVVKDPGTKKTMRVIVRSPGSEILGGHAFVLVGYNRVGFLVQNSWGTDWGEDGFATLPYDDWLDSAYDAWVARPGVPQTPFVTARSRTASATGGALATALGTDLTRLRPYVIDLGNNGRLSSNGKFTSSPSQIDQAITHMAETHDQWASAGDSTRRVVLWAHGGVVDEAAGLAIADRQRDWWLQHHVYPLFFVWESGPLETATDYIADRLRHLLPFRAAGFDLFEGLDRLVEGLARQSLWWMWNEMKQNAGAAGQAIPDSATVEWPPTSTEAIEAMDDLPGGSLLVHRLSRYAADHPDLEISLAGHSAGSILLAGLLERFAVSQLRVKSLSFMGAALRTDEFERLVLPRVQDGTVADFVTFVLGDGLELHDSCQLADLTFYHKSLLFLVARGFERPKGRQREIGIAGMERFLTRRDARSGRTLADAIRAVGGAVIVSPSSTGPGSNCEAKGHGTFDEDPATMASVLERITRVSGPAGAKETQAAPRAMPVAAAGLAATGGTPEPSKREPATVLDVLRQEGYEPVDDAQRVD